MCFEHVTFVSCPLFMLYSFCWICRGPLYSCVVLLLSSIAWVVGAIENTQEYGNSTAKVE